jgi:hypothetical protein
MSKESSFTHSQIPLLYRFLYDGIRRLSDLMNTSQFTFIVNDTIIVSSIIEAVLLSPAVYENLVNDESNTKFNVKASNITSEDFFILLEIVRLNRITILRSKLESLIEISRQLKNDRLEILFLSISNCSSTSIEVDFGEYFDVNIEMIASQFFSYSNETLLNFGLNVLNKILSNENVCVESEDSLLKTIVGFGDHFRSLLNHIRVDFLSESGLREFLKIISFHEICETQWMTIISRLEGYRDNSLQLRRFVKLLDSNILSEICGFPTILNDLKNIAFELLYRGSRDGFKMNEFHQRCDGRNRMLVLIKTTKENIFGGYTPLVWDSTTKDYKKDESMGTFLFTLKNPHGLDPIRFRLKGDGSTAIYCNSDRLAFGGGHDICLSDDCDTKTNSYTNFNVSFENSTKIDSNVLFDGAYNFTVEEIEVLAALK